MGEVESIQRQIDYKEQQIDHLRCEILDLKDRLREAKRKNKK
jgi:hypothetical protein